MAINPEDIKLLESERLTDESDGGGHATGREVVDGAVNNLFDDISRIDRTGGAVSLRKVFSGAITNNEDRYLGAHTIIKKDAADANVSVTLFNTDSDDDERADARDRIESYVGKSITADWELLGTHVSGTKIVTGFQKLDRQVPDIGDVFVLTQGRSGNPDDVQFIRIIGVEAYTQEFTYVTDSGEFKDFTARRLDLSISAPLNYDFTGGAPTPGGAEPLEAGDILPKINTTQVSNAARYFGVKTLVAGTVPGDVELDVGDIYSNIVPVATSETPIADQDAMIDTSAVSPARATTINTSQRFNSLGGNESITYLGQPVVHNSLLVNIDGGLWIDVGSGELRHNSGTNNFDKIEIDYVNGTLRAFRKSGVYTGTVTVTWTPGFITQRKVVSGHVEIIAATQGLNYTLALADAKPSPGTLRISYMVLGKWYSLEDDGAGRLTGNGSGSVSYDSGTVVMSLDALPDVGTIIVYQYGTDAAIQTTLNDDVAVSSGLWIEQDVTTKQIKENTLSITWTAGTAKTATDDGNGNITGDATGTVDYRNGRVKFMPANRADAGTDYSLDFTETSSSSTIEANASDNAVLSIILADRPINMGSVRVSFSLYEHLGYNWFNGEYRTRYKFYNLVLTDDNLGVLSLEGVPTGVTDDLLAGASIDYSTGVLILPSIAGTVNRTRKVTTRDPAKLWPVITDEAYVSTFKLSVNSIKARYTFGTVTEQAVNSIVAADTIGYTLDLGIDLKNGEMAPGMRLTWDGNTYLEKDGDLILNPDTRTGAGVVVGSVNLEDASITVNTLHSNATPNLTILSGVILVGDTLVETIAGRTPGAPLRPASFQFVWEEDGTSYVAESDVNGNITHARIKAGYVDSNTGYFEVEFNSGQGVDPRSIRYNTVVRVSLPLDASIIGLDPVRLPMDGRVPVFRDADYLVVLHENETDIGTPAADQVFDAGRTQIAKFQVVDSNGVALKRTEYTEDPTAGTLTFGNPLSLVDEGDVPLAPPLKVIDRIEHMTLATDVQVSGKIGIGSQCPHTFPVGSVVASAVVYGDKQARYRDLFDQQTWDSGNPNWGTEPIGNEATANYNDVDYPIQVTNAGSITEKWALVFTSSTSFSIYGEKVGLIGSGSTAADVSPVNPRTGLPYFTVEAAGWGSGWASGNVLRFDTEGAVVPLWVIRCVTPGQATHPDDEFAIEIRGDAD